MSAFRPRGLGQHGFCGDVTQFGNHAYSALVSAKVSVFIISLPRLKKGPIIQSGDAGQGVNSQARH